MKKKLEAELISIAHRILKLKNKSEVDQLLAQTQQLYEKLSVLKFVEENFADIKPTIGRDAAVEILETAFDEKEDAAVAETPKPDKKAASEKDKKVAGNGKSDTVEAKAGPVAEPSGREEKEDEDAPDAAVAEQPGETTSDGEAETKADPSQEMPETPETPENVKPEADDKPEEPKAQKDESEPKTQEDSHGAIEPDKPETVSGYGPVAEAGIAFEQPEAAEEAQAAKADEFFTPAFEWAFEPKTEDKAEDSETKTEEPAQQSAIAFEDLLGAGYKDPVFVKPGEEETQAPAEDNRIDPEPVAKKDVISISRFEDKVPVFKMNSGGGNVSLNDRVSKGITVGLNDRIAFVKNLFNNSNEDYNRVLSQLLTFDTLDQAKDFIDNMVKPDYGNWEGRDEYAQRFMEVVERKFS